MLAVPDPIVLCPLCRQRLFAVGDAAVPDRCDNCGHRYDVNLGIIDLRMGRHRIAGMDFDAAADMREAERLDAELARSGYRQWFFGEVDHSVAAIADPRKRSLATRYFAAEREIFGVHGRSVLEKLDAFLSHAEPARHAAWRAHSHFAVEAGCGGGQYPIGFAERFTRILVIDISYVALVQARRIALDHGITGISFIAANLEDVPLEEGVADFYHCNGVLEHVAGPDAVVRESARVLSRTGIAFILSPNRHSLYIEPHFRVLAFGWWPLGVRAWLTHRFSGAADFSGTELRSLSELVTYARAAFAHFRVYMLPRRLPATARGGVLRRTILVLQRWPIAGPLLDLGINRLLLRVMPYHIVVGFRT